MDIVGPQRVVEAQPMFINNKLPLGNVPRYVIRLYQKRVEVRAVFLNRRYILIVCLDRATIVSSVEIILERFDEMRSIFYL